MAASRPSLCITCGRDAGTGTTINRLQDGRACPTCAERLLDLLPPPFPGFGHLVETRSHNGTGDRSSRVLKTLQPRKTRRGRKRR